jgi:hypothetical protein
MILSIFLPNLHDLVVFIFTVCSLAEQGAAAEQGMLDASVQLLDILTEVLALLEPVATEFIAYTCCLHLFGLPFMFFRACLA